MAEEKKKIFDTEKRIKLGIWGLGRGGGFSKCAANLNMDVVAGCDYNKHIRDKFVECNPDVFVTDNEDEFLAQDIDAVLVATFFPDHAEHCIKALNAGKHVMCEVTSFMTPAQGVRLVEAVEKNGKVYNLLENYPFSKINLFAAKLWKEGLFGDFVYAEYDYNHDCRGLAFTYIDGVAVEPGYELHSWRSWLNNHYYNTHSLGPVMKICGVRPVQVSAPPYTPNEKALRYGGIPSPSLIRMDNGGIMRNLMGGISKDTHRKQIWGTKAALNGENDLEVTVGASGHGRTLHLKPEWPELGDLADAMGHGGGDFWELYYFAREILTGEKAPWDIYSACDVTLTGIMAVRSQDLGGAPVDVPDFRDKKVRDAYRNDNGIQKHIDPKTGAFPAGHDPKISGKFTKIMEKLQPCWGQGGTILIRKALDGMAVYPQLADDSSRLGVISDVRELLEKLDELADLFNQAKTIIAAYPDSFAGKTLASYLEKGEADRFDDLPKFRKELECWLIEKK